MSIDSATVTIRSVGERTEALCKKLILDQGISESNVFNVRKAPFSAAIKKSFEIGIEHGLPWTLCVDADVLLRENAIKKMIDLANQQKDNVCEIQGFILDKFFGGARQGGPHLYRTALLPKILKAIPAEGVNIRPETHALNTMKNLGFPWLSVTLLTGLHDFEQYNRDIFRKSIVQAHKHLDLMNVFVPYWREMAKTDYDYFVALSGVAAGILHYGDVFINVNQSIYSDLFSIEGIKEKAELCINDYSTDIIEAIIASWEEPDEYKNILPEVYSLGLRNKNIVYRENVLIDLLKKKLIDLGVVKFFIWLTSVALKKMGYKLLRVIEHK